MNERRACIRTTIHISKACEQLFHEISTSLDLRRSGFSVIASPRMGLSTALTLCRQGLSEARPGLPVVIIIGPKHGQYRQQEIWYALFASMGWLGRRSSNPGEVRRWTGNRLATLALEAKLTQVLMIVDRAHDIDFRHLEEIVLLEDQLRAEGLALTLCLAGNVALQNAPAELYEIGMHDPIKRYFRFVPFYGLRSADDLAVYLESFDQPRGGTETGNCSFSQLCFEDAYSRGWRLKHEASSLWSTLYEFRAVTQDVEMEAAHEVVCGVLEQGLVQGRGALPPDMQKWRDAVMSSNLPGWRSLEASLQRTRPRARP